MTSYKRFGNRWSINECLALQREFELVQLSIDEIAQKHQRTPNAIMLKLDAEGLADYNVLYSNYHDLNNLMPLNRKPTYDSEDLLQYDDGEEEVDLDNSSDYNGDDIEDDLSISDDEEDYDDENSSSPDNLKIQISRLEKQVHLLTQMMLKQSKLEASDFIF